MCHKTSHVLEQDAEDAEGYQAVGDESQCVGSMVYLMKAGAPSVTMRIAFALNVQDPFQLLALCDLVIDPLTKPE